MRQISSIDNQETTVSAAISKLRSLRLVVAAAAIAVLLADFLVPGLSNEAAAATGLSAAGIAVGLKILHLL
ncbi:MAG: hypothetical protein M9939_02030 [Mesorhizobium sp.]|nr:hypothetical protein [Mesorhizobium sp.]MCO5159889.1 hypothetical protein [Mesorhizobium sp.]